MSTPNKKWHKGEDIVRFEPQDLALTKSNPVIRVAFEKTWCIRFCEKIQGWSFQLTKEFALNFTRLDVKVGEFSFPVLDVTISATTEIPLEGEQLFKGMTLDIINYNDFLKPKCRNKENGAILQREYLFEYYSNIINVTSRYLTCEGRFGRFYQCHIRLLTHFTSKIPLSLPFYLFRSINKMADKF